MPIYSYRCGHCDHEFDEIQKFSDPATLPCEKCSLNADRTFSTSTSFQLKGDGWYKDGYSKKESGKALAQRTRQAHVKRDFD